MNNTIQQRIIDNSIKNRKRRLRNRIFSCLAAITVFCTVYVLIMPAVTLEKTAFCGFEEHIEHTDECYTIEKVLICENTDEDHVHTEDCYAEERVLTCTLPIHEHTLQCFSNPDADVESRSIWERTFDADELTGNIGEDILTIAESQIGYYESEDNYIVAEDGTTKNGYTRYGEWCGNPYGSWNTMFTSFCVSYASDGADIDFDEDAAVWLDRLEGNRLLKTADDAEPAGGDIVFIDSDEDGIADAAAIAERTEDGKVHVIEGDRKDSVSRTSYSVDCVVAYLDMNDSEPEDRVITLEAVSSEGTETLFLAEAAEENSEPEDIVISLDSESEAEETTVLALSQIEEIEETEPAEELIKLNGITEEDKEETEVILDLDTLSEESVKTEAEEPEVPAEEIRTLEDTLTAVPEDEAAAPEEIKENDIIAIDSIEMSSEISLMKANPLFGAAAEAPDYIGTINTANAWQITKYPYEGRAQSNKIPFGGTTNDPDGYLQKNVVPTGTENEFLVYLSLDKKATWESLFNSPVVIATRGNFKNYEYGYMQDLAPGSNDSYLYPEGVESKNYNLHVYFYSSGQIVYTIDGIRSGTTSNCNNACAFIKLNINGSDKYVLIGKNVNWQSEVTIDVNIDQLSANIGDFYNLDIYNTEYEKVIDTLGEQMEFVEFINSDSSSAPIYNSQDRTITWFPKDNANIEIEYSTGGSGTKWYENISQLVYKVRLKEGYTSCADTINDKAASISEGESYPTNNSAVLTYQKYLGDTPQGNPQTAVFPVPEVRGLLYDIKFIKIDKDTEEPLSGAIFGLYTDSGCTEAVKRTVNGVETNYTVTTGTDGTGEFSDLPWGTYYMKEITPPDRYKPIDTVWTINLCYTTDADDLTQCSTHTHNMRYTGEDDDTGNWYIENELDLINYYVQVYKVDKSSTNALANAVFEIANPEPNGTPSTLTGTTGTDGIYTFEKEFVSGSEYTLIETVPPEGYNPLVTDITFKVVYDENEAKFVAEIVSPDDVDGLAIELKEVTDEATNTSQYVVKVTVPNDAGYALPSTGGAGTIMFTASGIALLAIAFVIGCSSRRRRERREFV